MLRDYLKTTLDKYIDGQAPEIRKLVDANVDKAKDDMVETLSEKLFGFLTEKFDDDDDDDNFLEKTINVIASVGPRLSGGFKEKMKKELKENIDSAADGVVDFVTEEIVKVCKKVLFDALDLEDSSDEEEGEKEKKKSNISIFSGWGTGLIMRIKEKVINEILELIEPPIHTVGEDITKKLSGSFPAILKKLIIDDIGYGILPQDVDGDGKLDGFGGKILSLFGQDNTQTNIFNRMFSKIPQKIELVVRPIVKKFEQTLVQNISKQLHEKIFGEKAMKEGLGSYAGGGKSDSGGFFGWFK